MDIKIIKVLKKDLAYNDFDTIYTIIAEGSTDWVRVDVDQYNLICKGVEALNASHSTLQYIIIENHKFSVDDLVEKGKAEIARKQKILDNQLEKDKKRRQETEQKKREREERKLQKLADKLNVKIVK